jgi:hypothetical protein
MSMTDNNIHNNIIILMLYGRVCIHMCVYVCVCVYIYRCPRRKGPNFGRVFVRSNYTDITQNTYIRSSMITEILAKENCGLLWGLRTVPCP